jgi:serine-type D-Ala-D-Ala carboxypeptidase/endopeptidase (penicillin-binding protein 4)
LSRAARVREAVALLGVAALRGGCGASSHRAAHRLASVAPTPPAPAAPLPMPTSTSPPPISAAASSPALAALQSRLRAQLAAAGPNTGAVVFDLSRRTELFALRADVKRPPASVEKLYTSVAALKMLGPQTRLQTVVLGTGHLGRGGVWHGDLYLEGGGDPTFGDGSFNQVWNHGYGPTAQQLVSQLSARGIRRVAGLVIGDASLFDSKRGPPSSGYAPDIGDLGGQLAGLTYDHGATFGKLSPGAFAAHEMALTMRSEHIFAIASKTTGDAPANAQQLASVESPPISVLLKLMNVPSDDFFAEMLAKQLGVRFGAGGTTTAGATVISNAIASLGVHPRIVDGSGLSRKDATSPLEVVDLLRMLWRTPTGDVLRASLPVAGETGTLQGVGVHTAAQGRCQAKTGTLNYVSNLAGYCDSRGGDTLAFALFVDGPSNGEAFVLMSKMLTAIAQY